MDVAANDTKVKKPFSKKASGGICDYILGVVRKVIAALASVLPEHSIKDESVLGAHKDKKNLNKKNKTSPSSTEEATTAEPTTIESEEEED